MSLQSAKTPPQLFPGLDNDPALQPTAVGGRNLKKAKDDHLKRQRIASLLKTTLTVSLKMVASENLKKEKVI